jgi:SAM-dependent methyltransferase
VHLNSRLLFEKYALDQFRSGLRVLEIGPDGFPSTYQTVVGESSIAWDTVDLREDSRLTFAAASEYSFPIPDDTYDIVLSGQVIEHVRRIWAWMPEVARVCKVGGVVITINPVSWPYHASPFDCWRIYPEGMKALYEDAGLDVVLSRWDSLEARGRATYIPGRSHPARYRPPWVNEVFHGLAEAGFPVERAYDTITIGTKGGRA